MAWADVEAKIKFWGVDGTLNDAGLRDFGTAFDSEQKGKILDALKDLYLRSPTARTLLDTGASDIWLLNRTGLGSKAFLNSRIAGIDLKEATSFEWMGRDGRFKVDQLGGHVIHELIHAIYGRRDLPDGPRPYNEANFDHLGETVRLQNEIFQEMGWGFGYWQVGYDATFEVNPALLRHDEFFSYTEGQSIDIAYFDNSRNSTPNNLDLSNRKDGSNDLIIGFEGDDTIN